MSRDRRLLALAAVAYTFGGGVLIASLAGVVDAHPFVVLAVSAVFGLTCLLVFRLADARARR